MAPVSPLLELQELLRAPICQVCVQLPLRAILGTVYPEAFPGPATARYCCVQQSPLVRASAERMYKQTAEGLLVSLEPR